MNRTEPSTADALRRRASARLAAAGVESAAVDAAELVAFVLGTDPGRLILIDEVSSADREQVETMVGRRADRIPLQHLTGRAHFAGLDLAVGPGVFVPRPETELLAQWAVDRLGATGNDADPVRVTDLCSGSGALAIAIATRVSRATVTAVEKSAAARGYLLDNVATTGVDNRVEVVDADVTDVDAVLPHLRGRSVVVCNPPYVPTASHISPEVAHDPAEAVFSGSDGMTLIAALVPTLAAALDDGALVAIEHDDTTGPAVREAFAATGAFSDVTGHEDLAGRPRYVTATRRGRMEP
ncbi:peptide chain release factor N(5)-glutamine methyltransferase [Gordonia shandongensis]|uniref:peptide chain release factor N(5)-glutamine methyltransferase n=1 Tax=Gordonia shandongensis TaxID=376351 RepID=UPI000427C91B|nr:peptide chain release factor N(5)-glutamine methyltransferase [Gordonia shandongensis]